MKDKGVCIAASTFLSSILPSGSCGIDGLPLTPCSIRLLGKFQELRSIRHENLCEYIDLIRGSQERVVILAEHYNKNLAAIDPENIKERISLILHGIISGLDALAQKNITHRNLSPVNILLTDENIVKLSKYGLYFISGNNQNVDFPIGYPLYICPEHIIAGKNSQAQEFSHPLGDIWSFGILIFDWLTRFTLTDKYKNNSEYLITLTLDIIKSKENVLEYLINQLKNKELISWWPAEFKDLLDKCLRIHPKDRACAEELLKHPFINKHNETKKIIFDEKYVFWDLGLSLDCSSNLIFPNKSNASKIDYGQILLDRSVQEIYTLVSLTGGDIFSRLRTQDFINHLPSIFTFPICITKIGKRFGKKKDRTYFYNESNVVIQLKEIEERLKQLPMPIHYPLVVKTEPTPASIAEIIKFPVNIKEKNMDYQLYRMNMFRNLLNGYPYTRNRIIEEAKTDIPPIFRGKIWAALLYVKGNYKKIYDEIDNLTPTVSDRQIEVDAPRCHQYDQIMSSVDTREKLKRILKAWIRSNPHLTYWQGLDSLLAPFLTVNITDEALSFACLSQFVEKYCFNFFQKDNSSTIQEYLHLFTQLLAFHDPELGSHLINISFKPELYAIPWFLTMFSHVFPLSIVYQLWDVLLLGSSLFPMCVGVSILINVRTRLLSYDFNDCIILFADLPNIDIDECIRVAINIYNGTPPSVCLCSQRGSNIPEADYSVIELPFLEFPDRYPLNLSQLYQEICPRISCRDAFRIAKTSKMSTSKMESKDASRISTSRLASKNPSFGIQDKKKPLIFIDIRQNREFIAGNITDSVNIPVTDPAEPILFQTSEKLAKYKDYMLIICGNSPEDAVKVGKNLIFAGYRYVCALDAAIPSLSAFNIFTR